MAEGNAFYDTEPTSLADFLRDEKDLRPDVDTHTRGFLLPGIVNDYNGSFQYAVPKILGGSFWSTMGDENATPNEVQHAANDVSSAILLGGAPMSGASGSVGANALRRARPGQTVKSPYRAPLYPGIYDNPAEIAAEAASRVAPESPNLKKVFGVTRGDLADINQAGRRQGNMQPEEFLNPAPNPRGSESAGNVMTPKNRQRLVDALGEAGRHEDLATGMDNWYVMDPAQQRLVEMYGPVEGQARWEKLNTMMGMASPGSEVATEIARGLLAHYLAGQGRFGDFVKAGGNAQRMAELGIKDVPGHPYHSTSQAGPMQAYLDGTLRMESPKVPAYIAASGGPEKFQTSHAVPDAHWSRFVGLSDTRKGPTDIQASASMPEMQQLWPWWQSIAKDVGLEAVPAQARLWGAGSGQTGVTTPIGSPKLEMLADHIAKRAKQHRIPLKTARDKILSGELYSRGSVPVGDASDMKDNAFAD